MIVAILVTTSSVFAQSSVDTIINRGDGKVVIIDQRPRTIINRPVTNKPVTSEPIVIKLEQQPITFTHNTEPIRPVYNNNANNEIIIAILLIGAIGWFLVWFSRKDDKCDCNCHSKCNHNTQPPVINHFHVMGGNSVIDTSESWSNYQAETSYHKHTHMPPFMAAFGPKPKPEEKNEVKS
jgi:hypothetical protein